MSFKYDFISYFLSIVINLFFLVIFFSTLNFKILKEKEIKVKLISQVNFITSTVTAENIRESESIKEERVKEKDITIKKNSVSKNDFFEGDILKEKLAKIKSRVSERNVENDFSLSEKELKELEERMLAFHKRSVSEGIQENTQGKARDGESLDLEYLLLIKRKLQNNFEIPIYLRSKKDLYAVVNIELSSDGEILKYQFLKKSEISEFNKAVERCLKISSPLPVNKSVKIIVEFKAEGIGKIK